MLSNITIGKYYKTNSPIHGMDAFCKVICSILFIIITLISNTIEPFLILTIIVLLACLLSNVPFRVYKQVLFLLFPFLCGIFIINFIFQTNSFLLLKNIFQIVLITFYSNLLLFTTKVEELLQAFEKIFSPLRLIKINSQKISLLLVLAIRFIPIILEEAERILYAIEAQGFHEKNSLKRKIQILESLLIPLFRCVIKRADRLAISMELRFCNFSMKGKRKKRMPFSDTVFVLAHVIILVVVIRGV